MSTPLRELLAEFRNSAQTEREKGNYFERLAVAFIKNDHGMAQEYEDCWLYSEWAASLGLDGRDTGIKETGRGHVGKRYHTGCATGPASADTRRICSLGAASVSLAICAVGVGARPATTGSACSSSAASTTVLRR